MIAFLNRNIYLQLFREADEHGKGLPETEKVNRSNFPANQASSLTQSLCFYIRLRLIYGIGVDTNAIRETPKGCEINHCGLTAGAN